MWLVFVVEVFSLSDKFFVILFLLIGMILV